MLIICKFNYVMDGFKGYKVMLFVGEMSYIEINILFWKGDDFFLYGNKDVGCIGYFSGSEVLLFGCYGLFVCDDDSWYLFIKERRQMYEKEIINFIYGNVVFFGNK